MPESIWVLTESVKAIHNRQLAEHGGSIGIRDLGLLKSALARPKNAFRYSKGKSSTKSLAAIYACAITKNHPFVDGNKRVAFVVCMLFLKLNQWNVLASQKTLYTAFWDLAARKVPEENFILWLSSVSQKFE